MGRGFGNASGMDVIEPAIPAALGKMMRRCPADTGPCPGYKNGFSAARFTHNLSLLSDPWRFIVALVLETCRNPTERHKCTAVKCAGLWLPRYIGVQTGEMS